MSPDILTRTFPFTVRPGHRETIASYSRRTLEANGERASLPRDLLKLASTHDIDVTWPEVLSAKVRRPLDHLLAAGETAPRFNECRSCRARAATRWACLLCSRGERVQQHPHLAEFVCEHHRRWIGPGTDPDTQQTVSASAVRAHLRLAKLRRAGRLDIHLLFELMAALEADFEADLELGAHSVFADAVTILAWLTRRDILRRMFDPAEDYSETFLWLTKSLAAEVSRATPSTARAIWLHLWPAQVALQTAFRGYSGYHSGDPHDFTLPDDISGWYPAPESLQSMRDYLACTGDDPMTALAGRAHDGESEATIVRPRTRAAHCKAGHQYLEVITSDDVNGADSTPCPRCTGHYVQKGVNDLATVAPAIAAQLHPVLNGALTAHDITASSSNRVWWLCAEKQHPFRATPSNRTLVDSGCSICLNRVTLKGVNDLASTHPRIAAELHPSGLTSRPASELNAGDPIRRRWLCSEGHEYHASVKARVKGKSCDECARRRARTSGRSLLATHPELSATWRPELNEGRHPGDYTRGSRLDVEWWCDEGQHSFPMRIEARTRGCGCPYCAGRLLLSGFNDFATTHPPLASEWHPYRNRKAASEVQAGTIDLFHWRCGEGHNTEQSIPNRIKSGGCVRCSTEDRAGSRSTLAVTP